MGTLMQAYRRFAVTVRFHVDLCLPRVPRAKGKLGRRERAQRLGLDLAREAWRNVAALQAWTDAAMARQLADRRCTSTGGTVPSAWKVEKRLLAPMPLLPEPFDAVGTRPVAHDALVSFDGRQYSVPFTLIGTRVEVRSCAARSFFRGPC